MWALWLIPLVSGIFLVVSAASVAALFFKTNRTLPRISALVAAPFGCAVMPIFALITLSLIGSHFQKSDTQLYEQVFGYRPSITNDRLLFDNFGSGSDREIFFRVEPTASERRAILATPGLTASDFTLHQFVARGEQRGFMWWISDDPANPDFCKRARIHDVIGFRGWHELRIAECLEGGDRFTAATQPRYVYVVAAGQP